MRVFVTGHLGYIGVHLIDLLKRCGHQVTGCDIGLFEDCAWEPHVPPDTELKMDFRDLTEEHLQGHDCVMHLAALSNDPMGDLDEAITLAVNREGSIKLAKLSKLAGVPKFLFSGSCSVYGKGERLDLDEDDPLHPLTAYARSKIDTEAAVSAMADDSFAPAFLRNATAYGHSPMFRIDLVANNLLGSGFSRGNIAIMSDGSPWRPLVHCRDIALAFVAFLDAPADAIRNKAVNIGSSEENYQVRDIADEVQRVLPGAEISYTGEVGYDPRSYRVKFDLLNTTLPDFKLQYSLRSGIEEMHRRMVKHSFSIKDFDGSQFVRMRLLPERIHLLSGPPRTVKA